MGVESCHLTVELLESLTNSNAGNYSTAASMATASLPPSQILMYNKSKDSIQLSSTPSEYTFIIGVFGSKMVFAIDYFQDILSTL